MKDKTAEELKREFAEKWGWKFEAVDLSTECLSDLNALLAKLNAEKHTFTYDELKEFCCAFFRHWWNAPGNNTEQGFDEWFRSRMKCDV